MRAAAGQDRTSGSIVLAVDGGNVKTDLALVHSSGELLALVRGGRSSPHYLGVDGCISLLSDLLSEAVAVAALDAAERPLAASAQIMLAGADLPEELVAVREALRATGWTDRLAVDNDTVALLRSGTDRGWGVAVVCGGGINCIGIAPDGREVRFPSLGAITGDWGGGFDVGLAAVIAAARSEDGRGPKTILERAVPEHFAMSEPIDLARALHFREMATERLSELAPVVFAAVSHDTVAQEIVWRVADEVVAFATAALRRLDLTEEAVDVVLGGGLMRAASAEMIERVARGVHAVAPRAFVQVAAVAPIVGAALLGLDELKAGPGAAERARAELSTAFARVEGNGARVYPRQALAEVAKAESAVTPTASQGAKVARYEVLNDG